MFWPYHDTLFLNQSGENRGAFSDVNLRTFAEALDLDMDAFNTCFNSGRYAGVVLDERTQSVGLGVQFTPTFRINGELLEGLRQFEEFQAIIQSFLGNTQ